MLIDPNFFRNCIIWDRNSPLYRVSNLIELGDKKIIQTELDRLFLEFEKEIKEFWGKFLSLNFSERSEEFNENLARIFADFYHCNTLIYLGKNFFESLDYGENPLEAFSTFISQKFETNIPSFGNQMVNYCSPNLLKRLSRDYLTKMFKNAVDALGISFCIEKKIDDLFLQQIKKSNFVIIQCI